MKGRKRESWDNLSCRQATGKWQKGRITVGFSLSESIDGKQFDI